MARMTFKLGDEYGDKLLRLMNRSEETAKKAIYAGAAVMVDAVRANLRALPETSFRYLRGADIFDAVPRRQKEALDKSLGITPITQDRMGWWNAKVGFDGYGPYPSKDYPKGLPNQLVARSIESGSSFRQKIPFVAPAVRAKKKEVIAAMEKAVEDEIKKTMEGA